MNFDTVLSNLDFCRSQKTLLSRIPKNIGPGQCFSLYAMTSVKINVKPSAGSLFEIRYVCIDISEYRNLWDECDSHLLLIICHLMDNYYWLIGF